MEQSGQGALGQLVAKVEARVSEGEDISIGMIQAVAGQRAAGPMLLLPALIVVSPLSIIPGLPTLVGINTILIAGQVALGRQQIWLPHWLTERCLPAKHAKRLLGFLKPVSARVDSVVRRRWLGLTAPLMRRLGAMVCVMVGMIMPLLEFIPFTSTWAAAVIAAYGMAITARDGMLAVASMALVISVIGVSTFLLT